MITHIIGLTIIIMPVLLAMAYFVAKNIIMRILAREFVDTDKTGIED